MRPQRIQLSRTKGWRKPEGAIVVARPTKWGNPFRIGEIVTPSHPGWPQVTSFAEWGPGGFQDIPVTTVEQAVEMYGAWLSRSVGRSGFSMDHEAFVELRGHDLACWCPLDRPCHADVLLAEANP